MTVYELCTSRANINYFYKKSQNSDWWLYYRWSELLDATSAINRPTETTAILNILDEINDRKN